MKKEFLVAYDYGMGGLWGIMLARSEEEISALYPELKIAEARPKWMTDERYLRLKSDEYHDIDDVPWGLLNVVLADRRK